MKATGIVRKIDGLGRVVIPKEIRKTMRISDGDPLEIYTSDEGEVVFKKYLEIDEMFTEAVHVAEQMSIAARIATEACGIDAIETLVLHEGDKEELADAMRKIGKST
ncbi:MAG: AbrB/MazE/SpoVT family DNA-binding domain-containing protein, partial [Oscillospiraceae bacterium]|nr:AbrB/MazE/SpoVT family DNA-binding domain-containing protein [Oscillospiraceae bacterium]